MKRFSIFSVFATLLLCISAVSAQTTGAIAGVVKDSNGAIIPNATVLVKGTSGQEFTASTNDAGTFRIPAVSSGLYTVTVTSNGFKKSVTSNVKVDVGLPSTVDVVLEVGSVEQVVEVTSGGEVLQTQTATIGTTVTGRQITETPIASRDALDLVALMPGTASVGSPRRSSINGLPKGSLAITIDGVDVQDNLLRSSDGYFTYVRPRVDAIEEVTVSTTNPGAESSGDGAVQIKFVTKRGTNNYKGGLFWQHRNTALNANYWYSNRDNARDANGKALRQRMLLNQVGGNFGGPIPLPHFGEGGPYVESGKDKAFFFVNYEQFRLPETQNRSRTIFAPQAENGIFQYIVGTETRSVNLFTLAAAGGVTSTPDPAVASLLQRIRSAVGTTGTITPITNSPNTFTYNFTPAAFTLRKFLAVRLDYNINQSNSVEFVTNQQQFVPSKDFLNSQEERFPGFPWYAQGSNRDSYSGAVRSTLTKNIINEARLAISTGFSQFSPGISPADFSIQGGYDLGLGAAGITTATSRNSYSGRNSPTWDLTDSLTWIKGNHSLSFGGQYKRIKLISEAINRIVPSIAFGVDTTDTAANNAFTTANIPGASAAQVASAKAIWATLVGRVTGYTTTAYLTADGTYKENALQLQRDAQDTYGLYAQDSWKLRPNLTINYGIRWQPQGSYKIMSGNYARLSSFADVYGLSGEGNLFKPGTLTGRVPTVIGMKIGEKAYQDDKNNFAPTVGVVWSPSFGDGILKTIFGGNGSSVFRGGWSRSFVREGTALIGSLLGANPGGTQSATRSIALGNLTVGTLLRTAGNPNLTPAPFPASPAYPFTLTAANSANAMDPNLKTGHVDSFSFGYQREINKDTVVEVRYSGNRGYDLFRQHNINELNTIENGYAAEFALAQQNFYANVAAGRGATFAYFGAGTGTSPLPLTLAYINPAATYQPNNAAVYNSTLFSNATLIAPLSRNAANIISFAGLVENSAARRANALANSLPSNFFYANSTTLNTGAFILDNSAKSWYDSGSIEVRRRLSNGLRIQASYVWSKAQSDSVQSNSDNFANYVHRSFGRSLARNVAVFDIRHNFKFDATYDLPFGKGRKFFSNAGGVVNAIFGGFTILPTIRWQSGSPISFGNVQLVGMTKRDFQKEIRVRKLANVVTFLPDDIILNTQRAFDVSITSATGYGTTFGGGGAPQGRFLAPAGYGNCQQRYAGECGFSNLIVYGPSFFKLDATVSKRFMIGEKRSIEFKATFLDALNAPNFRIGGWGADVVTSGVGGTTFGQLATGSAYQDVSTTNDPGGRLIDLTLRINF